MFVVRVVVDAENTDWKVFASKPPAKERFDSGIIQTIDGEFETIALFEVEGVDNPSDAKAAVEAGADGAHGAVRLLDFVESRDRMIARLPPLDLSLLKRP